MRLLPEETAKWLQKENQKADKIGAGFMGKEKEMIKASQTCRVCGIQVPAGFTNCDGCYHKTAAVKVPPRSKKRKPCGLTG